MVFLGRLATARRKVYYITFGTTYCGALSLCFSWIVWLAGRDHSNFLLRTVSQTTSRSCAPCALAAALDQSSGSVSGWSWKADFCWLQQEVYSRVWAPSEGLRRGPRPSREQ